MASLCAGWTVRDVVAHLTVATRWTTWTTVRGIARYRGDLHRLFDETARDRATEFGPAELVAQLRETAASAKRFPGASVNEPLTDILVHGQDIVRPLGRIRTMSPERATTALASMWNSGFFGGRARFAGVRLVATDVEWAAGEGAELRGPVGELLLVASGRSVGLAALDGPGAAIVTGRMAG